MNAAPKEENPDPVVLCADNCNASAIHSSDAPQNFPSEGEGSL